MHLGTRVILAAVVAGSTVLAPLESKAAAPSGTAGKPTEQWGIFELALKGPRDGNPFVDVELWGEFWQGERRQKARGFYDGEGVYRVRFMPDRQGTWQYVTRSNRPELAGRSGRFQVTRPSSGNHGPVRVRDRFHFAFADGQAYQPFGTTVYALVHQEMALQEQTMATLAKAPFNKLRTCLFPKWYAYNRTEPPLYPFDKAPAQPGKLAFDLGRPNPAFFRLLERRILELQKLGVEVDLILFHPYDEGHWGFDRMGREADERTLRYVIARLAAYRNVWWSMANEWDFVKNRTVEEWNRLFDIVEAEDPYARLASIHNGRKFFDHKRTGISHVSVQSADVGRMIEWREQYGKPVIDDECEYEGDIENSWGSLSARALVYRHWIGFLRGGFVGHGETYRRPDDVLWWSKGGVLRGESPPRIAFMRKLVEQGGPLQPLTTVSWTSGTLRARHGNAFLIFYADHQVKTLTPYTIRLLADKDPALMAARWRFEVIDPWEMTIVPLPGEHQGEFEVPLPGKPNLVLRATPILPAVAPIRRAAK